MLIITTLFDMFLIILINFFSLADSDSYSNTQTAAQAFLILQDI